MPSSLSPLRAGKRLYHIVDRRAWEAAQSTGEYRDLSLAKEGFIHCSTVSQVIRVANQRFRGQAGLVLLAIVQSRLQARVQYENLDGGAELFPHIYGALNVDAVEALHAFDPGSDGTFVLPAAILPSDS